MSRVSDQLSFSSLSKCVKVRRRCDVNLHRAHGGGLELVVDVGPPITVVIVINLNDVVMLLSQQL